MPLSALGTPVLPDGKIKHFASARAGLTGVGDFPGLRPSMQVQEGDQVRKGQQLWVDKKNPALVGAAPQGGRVVAVHRGDKRALLSVEIEVDKDIVPISYKPVSKSGKNVADSIRRRLIEAGLWPALRERPYDKVPAADSQPAAVLVTAMDNRPLAVDPEPLLQRHAQAFAEGLEIVASLTSGPVLVCARPGQELPAAKLPDPERLVKIAVDAPWPGSLPGMLLHHYYPPALDRKVWYLDWQHLVQWADLIRRGTLPERRYVSLGGGFANPRVISAAPGADLRQLAEGALATEPEGRDWRLVSGSPVFGNRVSADGATAWLGYYHAQACAIADGGEPVFLNWMRPGFDRYSRLPIFVSSLFRGTRFALNTLRHGGDRGMLPLEVYQDVMPADLPAVHLLKALLVGDTERAQELGCLEFGEEDLAACTFVCPSKYDYASALRTNLDRIEVEG